MVKMDSVIRESLRLHSMGSRGLSREVVAPEGVTTPDGLYLPCSTHLCIIASNRQHELDVWERGDEFLPFRFVRPTNESTVAVDTPRHAVHVTEDFLSFGYGQHAWYVGAIPKFRRAVLMICSPGRFFAVQALKVLLGLLIMNYDIQPLTERPKSLEIGEVVIPSEKTTVKIKRRQVGPA